MQPGGTGKRWALALLTSLCVASLYIGVNSPSVAAKQDSATSPAPTQSPTSDDSLRLKQSQDEAHRECQRFRNLNPSWAWKFRILEAESLLWRGMSQETIAVLNSVEKAPEERNPAIQPAFCRRLIVGKSVGSGHHELLERLCFAGVRNATLGIQYLGYVQFSAPIAYDGSIWYSWCGRPGIDTSARPGGGARRRDLIGSWQSL